MLYFIYDRNNQVAASNKDANKTIGEINASGKPADDDSLAYLKRNDAYVKKTKLEATLSLVGFFGIWGLGIVDAVWDPFSLHKKPRAKVKATAEVEDDSAEQWVEARKLEKLESQAHLGLLMRPTKDSSQAMTYGLTWNKSFR